jgi:sugar lactone lactonase YvrE
MAWFFVVFLAFGPLIMMKVNSSKAMRGFGAEINELLRVENAEVKGHLEIAIRNKVQRMKEEQEAAALDNGDLADASFSQPSGLALRDGKLYVADPESSAVREIDLAQGRVSTLAGRGLFDFGDRDGPLVTARLQHAQAVLSWGEDQLLIADTYNHKLKRLDLTARRLATLLGDGQAGSPHGDLKPGLDEPGGLARLGDQVLIADTNNGRILAFDPATGKARVWEPRES